ncbi:hypothetical protein L2D00_04720 [Hyphomonadaceae bacterium BL14]|nr:hypothetical protein L2D00_04720 [Hyphomonadaceae bacterium BL14]
MAKVRSQKGITISTEIIPGAGHLFSDHLEPLQATITTYLDKCLPEVAREKAEPGPVGKR